jgi:TonB family protein
MHENDIESARAAFATLIQFQKTDDIRALDLFSRNCSITFTIIEGKTRRSEIIPADVFRRLIRKAIALKRGSKTIYEDVKFSKEGARVRVTASFRPEDSSDRGRFFAVYGRDDKAILKIQELKLTMSAPHTYTAAELKAMFTKTVQPDYPFEARRLRHIGRGVFRLTIDEQGRVTSVKAVESTGYGELDASCLVAFRQWQARTGPKRVVAMPVTFTMESGNASPSQTWNLPPSTSNRLGPVAP